MCETGSKREEQALSLRAQGCSHPRLTSSTSFSKFERSPAPVVLTATNAPVASLITGTGGRGGRGKRQRGGKMCAREGGGGMAALQGGRALAVPHPASPFTHQSWRSWGWRRTQPRQCQRTQTGSCRCMGGGKGVSSIGGGGAGAPPPLRLRAPHGHSLRSHELCQHVAQVDLGVADVAQHVLNVNVHCGEGPVRGLSVPACARGGSGGAASPTAPCVGGCWSRPCTTLHAQPP